MARRKKKIIYTIERIGGPGGHYHGEVSFSRKPEDVFYSTNGEPGGTRAQVHAKLRSYVAAHLTPQGKGEYAYENPLTTNMKWGLVVAGGLVGVGLIAYFATRPAAAALPGTGSNLVVPAKLLKGHRYTLKATAPNPVVQAESTTTVASVQAAADAFGPGAFKVFSVNFATGTGGTGSMTIVFDVLADIVPAIPATATADLAGKGVSILVTDMGMTP